MREAEAEAVAGRDEAGLEIVDANDLPTDRHRRQVAEAQEAAGHMPGQLKLHPDLRQPRTVVFRNDPDGQAAEHIIVAGRPRGYEVALEAAGQRMALVEEAIQRPGDLTGVAGDSGGMQTEKVAVDRPAPNGCRLRRPARRERKRQLEPV